jgi:hypothetical protein
LHDAHEVAVALDSANQCGEQLLVRMRFLGEHNDRVDSQMDSVHAQGVIAWRDGLLHTAEDRDEWAHR